ncbi:unnamed protein product [Lampetra planeri]
MVTNSIQPPHARNSHHRYADSVSPPPLVQSALLSRCVQVRAGSPSPLLPAASRFLLRRGDGVNAAR